MMDQTDEFQFKPLTDGLGFHSKKKANLKSKSGLAKNDQTLLGSNSADQNEFSKSYQAISDLQTSKTASLDMLESPLPRESAPSFSHELGSELEITPSEFRKKESKTSVDEILRTLRDRRKLTIKDDRKVLRPQPAVAWKKSSWELPAFLLDAMLWAAIILTATVSLLMTTKIDIFQVLAAETSDRMLYVSVACMIGGFTWIYLVTTRIFMGCTPGEWVFDQRVGSPEQFGSAYYYLAISFRALFVILTGFVLFPILSMLLNEDIVGKLTGIELVKKA